MGLEAKLNDLSQEIAALGGLYNNEKVDVEKYGELTRKVHTLTIEVFNTPGASMSEAWEKLVKSMQIGTRLTSSDLKAGNASGPVFGRETTGLENESSIIRPKKKF